MIPAPIPRPAAAGSQQVGISSASGSYVGTPVAPDTRSSSSQERANERGLLNFEMPFNTLPFVGAFTSKAESQQTVDDGTEQGGSQAGQPYSTGLLIARKPPYTVWSCLEKSSMSRIDLIFDAIMCRYLLLGCSWMRQDCARDNRAIPILSSCPGTGWCAWSRAL